MVSGRTDLITVWRRASEWPLMIARVGFLAAYAVPILNRLSCERPAEPTLV